MYLHILKLQLFIKKKKKKKILKKKFKIITNELIDILRPKFKF